MFRISITILFSPPPTRYFIVQIWYHCFTSIYSVFLWGRYYSYQKKERTIKVFSELHKWKRPRNEPQLSLKLKVSLTSNINKHEKDEFSLLIWGMCFSQSGYRYRLGRVALTHQPDLTVVDLCHPAQVVLVTFLPRYIAHPHSLLICLTRHS